MVLPRQVAGVSRQAHDLAAHLDESVARERGDRLAVELLHAPLVGGHEPQCSRAALPERALERPLPAQRLEAAPAGGAAFRERADAAARHAREADRLAEVHQRLRRCRREVGARPLAHPPDVHVDRQHVAAEGEARDRVGGVAPNAGKLRQVVGPAVRGYLLRGPLQRERAPVVAEPLPLADHVGRRRSGERLHGRPALEPALPAWRDPLDLRLLRHHLADENRVRVASLSPREIPAVLAEPGGEQLLHAPDPR